MLRSLIASAVGLALGYLRKHDRPKETKDRPTPTLDIARDEEPEPSYLHNHPLIPSAKSTKGIIITDYSVNSLLAMLYHGDSGPHESFKGAFFINKAYNRC